MRGDLETLRGEMRGDLGTLRGDAREDHAGLDARLRSVQVEFGKVDQRLQTLERVVIPQAPPAA